MHRRVDARRPRDLPAVGGDVERAGVVEVESEAVRESSAPDANGRVDSIFTEIGSLGSSPGGSTDHPVRVTARDAGKFGKRNL
jgi:hypothetical protein